MPDQLPAVRGRGVPDMWRETPGLQLVGGTGRRVRALSGSFSRDDFEQFADGSLTLWAIDPLRVNLGLQMLPQGTRAGDVHRSVQLYGQLLDGNVVPIARRKRRTMNPANHRATKRAIRRVHGAIKHAKKLFRVEKSMEKSVKKKRRR